MNLHKKSYTTKMKLKRYFVVTSIIVVFAILWWLWGDNIRLITGNYETISETRTTTYSDSAVRLAVGDILIFKTSAGEYGAIKFTKITNNPGADYMSWVLKNTNGGKKKWEEFKGHVFEKYWRTQTLPNQYWVTNIGGAYQLQCGDNRLGWSASTWIYLPNAFIVSVIRGKSIDQIDVLDKTIVWRTQPYKET